MEIKILPAKDAQELAELFSAPIEVMQDAIDSDEAWVGWIDGKPLCCWGLKIANFMTGDRVAWMYATEEIHRHRIAFLRMSRRYCQMASEKAGLYAFARCDFPVARNWLKWVGFKPLGEAVVGGIPVVGYQFGG